MVSKQFLATSTLIGTIIGAGFLGIPYVISKSGFLLGIINLVIVGIIITISMLYLGEITLRTKNTHQLTGYAEKYLGHKGKMIMLASVIFGTYAAILAYLIAEGESFSQIIFNTTEYSFYLGIAFWLIMSIMIYFGIKALEEGELIGVVLIFFLLILIIVTTAMKINPENLSAISFNNLLFPFGVILFAFLGFSGVPEIKRILGSEQKSMRKSILIAHIFVFLVYATFTAIVIGFKGPGTPQIATLALGKIFIALGIFTIFTSYLSLSVALIDAFRFDFKKTKIKAWLYTIIIPLLFYLYSNLYKKADFTHILGIGGVISGGITAILIIYMHKKAKVLGDRRPEFSLPHSKIISWTLIALFTIGTIAELYYSLR